jgi:hypothetical protein
MSTRILIALLACFALINPGTAQEEAEEAEEAEQASTEDASQAAPEREDSDDDESADQRVIDEFTFSEEIPADTQLVFPVDI